MARFLLRPQFKGNDARPMTIFTAHHTTTYRYSREVGFGKHHMMVLPVNWSDQRVVDHTLSITPEPAKIETSRDKFGNRITTASFDRPSDELSFQSRLQVEKNSSHEKFVAVAEDSVLASAGLWLERAASAGGDPVSEWARDVAGPSADGSPLDRLVRVNSAVRSTFRYMRRLEKGTRSPAETLRLGSGSCRDFATLVIDAARSLGYPARFASGYIRAPFDKHAIVGAGSTHAWLQVHIPEHGWIDLDPTNGTVGAGGLVRVAVTSSAAEALPLCGTWIGKAADFIGMTVTVTVSSDDALNGKRASPLTRLAAAAAN